MVKIQVGHQAAWCLSLWAALGFPSASALPAPSCLTHSLGLSCCAFSKGGCRPARWQDEITLAYDGRFGVNNCYKSRGRRAGLAPCCPGRPLWRGQTVRFAARCGLFCNAKRPLPQCAVAQAVAGRGVACEMLLQKSDPVEGLADVVEDVLHVLNAHGEAD